MAPPVGLLVGHSFVHGLHSHLSPHNQPSTGHSLARALHIHSIVQEFHLHGERGARLCSPTFALPTHLLTRARPDFVILDLGSNDIATGTPPFDVAAKLIQITDILISQYHVRCVVMCSIVNRQSHIAMPADQFATAAYQLNHYLRNFAATNNRAMYHVHKGFWNCPISSWSRDGIHPNTSAGRKKYLKSIRRAIFTALQTFTSQ